MKWVQQLRERLPETERPSWLAQGAMSACMPLGDLLPDSVYYPASGLDGDPLLYLGHHFWSFIYVDYGLGHETVVNCFASGRFWGYRVVGQRTVDEKELGTSRGGPDLSGSTARGARPDLRRETQTSFCEWLLLERSYGDDRPPELMSLLFLGGEGVTAYQRLYTAQGFRPACVAIIQPGGPPQGASSLPCDNWTYFPDPHGVLAEVVEQNPAGTPRFLLYGGRGRPEYYRTACWPAYRSLVTGPLEKTRGQPFPCARDHREGAISIWERAEP